MKLSAPLLEVVGQIVEEADALAAACNALVDALTWYVVNDDTNLGEEGNEFWEAGHYRALNLLERLGVDIGKARSR